MKLRNILLSLCSVWVLLFIAFAPQQFNKAEPSRHTHFNIQPKESFSSNTLLLNTEATTSLFQTCSGTVTVTLRDNFSDFKSSAKQYLKNGYIFFTKTFSRNVFISLSQIPAKVFAVFYCTFLI